VQNDLIPAKTKGKRISTGKSKDYDDLFNPQKVGASLKRGSINSGDDNFRESRRSFIGENKNLNGRRQSEYVQDDMASLREGLGSRKKSIYSQNIGAAVPQVNQENDP